MWSRKCDWRIRKRISYSKSKRSPKHETEKSGMNDCQSFLHCHGCWSIECFKHVKTDSFCYGHCYVAMRHVCTRYNYCRSLLFSRLLINREFSTLTFKRLKQIWTQGFIYSDNVFGIEIVFIHEERNVHVRMIAQAQARIVPIYWRPSRVFVHGNTFQIVSTIISFDSISSKYISRQFNRGSHFSATVAKSGRSQGTRFKS